jgi:hypothetical protein
MWGGWFGVGPIVALYIVANAMPDAVGSALYATCVIVSGLGFYLAGTSETAFEAVEEFNREYFGGEP